MEAKGGIYNKSYEKAILLIGNRFGTLVIKEVLPIINGEFRKIVVECDCGVFKTCLMTNVTSGKTTNCGCIGRKSASERFSEYNKKNPQKSGNSNPGYVYGISTHPLYIVWKGMQNRCYNKNDVSYKRYGGKGVIICEEWKDNPLPFYEWGLNNGWKPGLQIDKDIKAKELGAEPLLYSPERCMFVTRKRNCRDRITTRKLECRGEIKTLVEWCEITGLNHSCIIRRIDSGWRIEDALFTPSKKINKK